jgi:ATP synthase
MGGVSATLRALVREYVFISLFRACAESLASENASRLAAMERADKNIGELEEVLCGAQPGIDARARRCRAYRGHSVRTELHSFNSSFPDESRWRPPTAARLRAKRGTADESPALCEIQRGRLLAAEHGEFHQAKMKR